MTHTNIEKLYNSIQQLSESEKLLLISKLLSELSSSIKKSLNFHENVDKNGWSNEFFEKTAGCLEDDPIFIDSEGDYEVREKIL